MNPEKPTPLDPVPEVALAQSRKGQGNEPGAHSQVSLGRWWIATLIIALGPLLINLIPELLFPRTKAQEDAGLLPLSVRGLILFCLFELAIFGVNWLIAWLVARPTKDDLLLRMKNVWDTLGRGILYSIGMRIAAALIFAFILSFLALLGFDSEKMLQIVQKNGEGTVKAFGPAITHGGLHYRVVLMTLVSFVVAGFREELWRSFTLAGIRKICPPKWGELDIKVVALVASSFLFGLGHIYQGATGVIQTMILGIILGAITLHHKSIWPAVLAHGFFDATSFALFDIATKVKH